LRNLRFVAIIALILISAPLFAQPPQSVVIEGRREPQDCAYNMGSFYYLPFDVPPGVTKLTIERDMSIEPPGGLGLCTYLFDARGIGFPYSGFRGCQEWQTDPIVITADKATTTRQFYHGPIQPGRWHIAQHFRWKSKDLERIRYKYTITFSFDGPRLDSMPEVPYDPIIRNEPGWYTVDLHTHTIHSDGQGTLDEVAAFHASAGYDAMVNTDHNVMTAQFDFPEVAARYPNMLFLAGEEISTLSGHANVIGAKPGGWYDPRMIPGDGRLPKLIEKVHREGALFSVNHPFAKAPMGWAFPPEEWTNADSMEIFQGGWFGADDRQAADLWDSLLKSGKRITGVGGTDTHAKTANLKVLTWVWAENLSREAIVDGIRKGHVFISYQKSGPLPYISVPGTSALPGDTVRIGNQESVPVQVRVVGGKDMTLRLVWQDGETKIPIDRTFARIEYSVPVKASLSRSYVRLEVQRADGVVFALTNPIYFER